MQEQGCEQGVVLVIVHVQEVTSPLTGRQAPICLSPPKQWRVCQAICRLQQSREGWALTMPPKKRWPQSAEGYEPTEIGSDDEDVAMVESYAFAERVRDELFGRAEEPPEAPEPESPQGPDGSRTRILRLNFAPDKKAVRTSPAHIDPSTGSRAR